MEIAAPTKYLMPVSRYHDMIEAGIFDEDEAIELIEGELTVMAPIGSDHTGTTRQLIHWFSKLVSDQALVDAQNPITLGQYSEPQPDITLLKFREDFYKKQNPQPEDTLLVVEIAHSSLKYDREIKMPLYARHGIPEAWIINLVDKRIEIFREPAETGYQQILSPDKNDTVTLVALPEVSIQLNKIWEGL